MPPIKLDENAAQYLIKYRWNGNIRQLRNIAEQISVLETNREISLQTIHSYLPQEGSNLPALIKDRKAESDFSNEREILYKVLFDMKSDLSDLKKLTLDLIKNGSSNAQETSKGLIQKIYGKPEENSAIFDEEPKLEMLSSKNHQTQEGFKEYDDEDDNENYLFAETVEEEETLSLEAREIELIKKSLDKNKGKRKAAADELGISERTLYRKIKQYDL